MSDKALAAAISINHENSQERPNNNGPAKSIEQKWS
jgi:hypothetical protein